MNPRNENVGKRGNVGSTMVDVDRQRGIKSSEGDGTLRSGEGDPETLRFILSEWGAFQKLRMWIGIF
jgi:hypothetical protein